MCGIAGVIGNLGGSNSIEEFEAMAEVLERRGHDAFGFAALDYAARDLRFGKLSLPFHKAIRSDEYKNFRSFVSASGKPELVFGHTRLATHGGTGDSANNQPVVYKDWIVVHNGIITNEKEVKEGISSDICALPLDTYASVGFLSKLSDSADTFDFSEVMRQFNAEIKGANNFAIYSAKRGLSILFSSNGSLYLQNRDGRWYFSSEKRALPLQEQYEATQLLFPNVFVYDHRNTKGGIYDVTKEEISFGTPESSAPLKEVTKVQTAEYTSHVDVVELGRILEREFKLVSDATKNVKRCTKCLLPATFPGIVFDSSGECSICAGYQSAKPKLTKDDLYNRLTNGGTQDKVLVSLSGGRDSCFTLHTVVKELGLKASAFTYDWGMVTDLARRNQSRMCGDLKVEHLIVSADIEKKRKYIKDNVSAWLRRPSLGTIPLFMAGDKHYFYYAEKVKKENGLHLNVMGENKLEKTGFKTRFAGAEQSGENSSMAYSMSTSNKIKMLSFYGTEFAVNPGYWNASLWDTFTGYLSYYVYPRTYLNLFDYVEWNENVVDATLKQYDWEYSPDCATSWRIGDGTAPFYNFIYHSVVGFSENDTLRANQIREGHLTIEQAKSLIERDNHPRPESFAWYCDVLGLDAIEVAKAITRIPKLY